MELPNYAMNIKQKRENKLLTQEQLAVKVGVSSNRVISLYECGKRRPSVTTCKLLAKALGGKARDYRL